MNFAIKQIISSRIKKLRISRGLTIEQLAYQSGISKGGLSEIEKSKKLPTIFTIMKICACLNISLPEFFNYEDIDCFLKKL